MWKNVPLFPEQASTLAGEVDALYFTFLGISVFFGLLVAGLVIFFAIRFRRRSPDEIGRPEKAGILLEVVWSAIPLAILLTMFAWGAKVYVEAFRPPGNAVEYFVTAKQWMWKFQHPQGNREINVLHVPLGQPIRLTMTSEDVIHSFFVPAFRVKADVLPGRYTTVWFEASKVGTFHLFCAEYCGAEHSVMGGNVIVMEPADYEVWLAGRDSGPSVVASGEELFRVKACSTCHRPDSATLAPMLQGIFGEEAEFEDGSTQIVDENYIRESILNPTAKVVKGYKPLMPTYKGQLTEEEVLQLIGYIKSLASDATASQATLPASSSPALDSDEG
jgi:cytochrome c oxidase subunit 2